MLHVYSALHLVLLATLQPLLAALVYKDSFMLVILITRVMHVLNHVWHAQSMLTLVHYAKMDTLKAEVVLVLVMHVQVLV